MTPDANAGRGTDPDRAAAQAAKDSLAERLRADSRVVGIGLSRAAVESGETGDTGDPGYVIEVRLSDPAGVAVVPPSVSDIPVRTRVVGPIEPR